MIGSSIYVIISCINQFWLYLVSNTILSVGMLLILIHIVLVLIDKIKRLIK